MDLGHNGNDAVGPGVFVDGRTHWVGHLGQAALAWHKYRGGVMAWGSAAERGGIDAAMTLAVRLRLKCTCEPESGDYGRQVLVRQEADPAPKFHFLEEGAVRLGLRIAFDLLDDEGHYHGDGRQDIWLYPEGDIHVTWAVQTVDLRAHSEVSACWVEAQCSGHSDVGVGDNRLGPTDRKRYRWGRDLTDRAVVLQMPEPMALYWARDQGYPFAIGSDHGSLPPFYASRWPTAMQQSWSAGKMGWAGGKGAGLEVGSTKEGTRLRFYWLKGAAEKDNITCAATLVLSRAANEAVLRQRILAVQQPLVPQVSGGDFRCYTEEDGLYEIGQGDPGAVEVVFPPDPLERQVRLRHYRRKTDPRHRGGVDASCDGEKITVQLVSEGELTDDVCVVMEMAPRRDSVDDVIFSGRLKAKAQTVFRLEKKPGIQATYQSEISGVDLQRRAGNRRDLAVWSSRNPYRPLFELDLFSGALHRLSGYDQKQEALWEMPLMWFKSCGISKHDYCNNIKDLDIKANGPDAIEIYLRGTNPNGRAQSELWLRVPYGHSRLRLEVRMRLEVLEQWDHANVEFSDIFPYPSRLVETWFHQAVLFMQGGRTSLVYTHRPDKSYHTGGTGEDNERLFYGLFGTGRGNVLTLIKNRSAKRHKMHYSVCGNYIDVHVNLTPAQVPVPRGEVFEVEYVCELYGDENTTVDQIRQIGQRSLAAGDIVVEDKSV
jgi:hypothetical protein